MEFFLLVVINIFIGCVFYLVISLKLEKKSSEYRERRMRQEMDEIITEFNAVAERNISLLEKRIELMKKLLEKSGALKSIDITLEDAPAKSTRRRKAAAETGKKSAKNQAGEKAATAIPIPEFRSPAPRGEEFSPQIKKGLLSLRDKGMHLLFRGLQKLRDRTEQYVVEKQASREVPAESPLIEKDLSELPAAQGVAAVPADEGMTDDEIRQIVETAGDKYSMIIRLHDGGCGPDDIARFSGIPAGEVRLVLNLQRGIGRE